MLDLEGIGIILVGGVVVPFGCLAAAYPILRRAHLRLSAEQRRSIEQAFSKEKRYLPMLLPVIAVMCVLSPIAGAVTSVLAAGGTTVWTASKLLRLQIPRWFLHSQLAATAITLGGFGAYAALVAYWLGLPTIQ